MGRMDFEGGPDYDRAQLRLRIKMREEIVEQAARVGRAAHHSAALIPTNIQMFINIHD